MKLDPKILPPALNPLYAELSFDDINHQGIHITKRPLLDGLTQKDALEVTVTVSCRRPPKFYAPFDPGDKAPDYMAGTKYLIDRRRATALDFAVSGVVGKLNSSIVFTTNEYHRTSEMPMLFQPFPRAHALT